MESLLWRTSWHALGRTGEIGEMDMCGYAVDMLDVVILVVLKVVISHGVEITRHSTLSSWACSSDDPTFAIALISSK